MQSKALPRNDRPRDYHTAINNIAGPLDGNTVGHAYMATDPDDTNSADNG
jgi:hypothetical protein